MPSEGYRKLAPRPGMLGRLDYAKVWDGPPGWPPGTRVRVIRQVDERTFLVRRRDLQEIEMAHYHIDVGWEVKLGGRWYHEGSPTALDFWEAELADVERRMEAKPELRHVHASTALMYMRTLARYGRLPPPVEEEPSESGDESAVATE